MGDSNEIRKHVDQAQDALGEVADLLADDTPDWRRVRSLLLRARGWLQVAHASVITRDD